MSRDNARTPMQWDASPNAGFTTGTPWITVNPNHPEINVRRRSGDPDSVFQPLPAADRAAARRSGRHRRRFRAPAAGTPDRLGVPAPGRDASLLIAANLSADAVPVWLPLDDGWAAAATVLTSLPDQPARPPSISSSSPGNPLSGDEFAESPGGAARRRDQCRVSDRLGQDRADQPQPRRAAGQFEVATLVDASRLCQADVGPTGPPLSHISPEQEATGSRGP